MANFKLTQTGEQIQADLNLLDRNSATSGQVLTANGTGGASWQNASGGSSGSQVGGGYTLHIYSDTGYIHYRFLGTKDGVYGWHDVSDSNNGETYQNVSIVIIETVGNHASADNATFTQNALYLYDGTPVNTHDQLKTSVAGKICILKGNFDLTYYD